MWLDAKIFSKIVRNEELTLSNSLEFPFWIFFCDSYLPLLIVGEIVKFLFYISHFFRVNQYFRFFRRQKFCRFFGIFIGL